MSHNRVYHLPSQTPGLVIRRHSVPTAEEPQQLPDNVLSAEVWTDSSSGELQDFPQTNEPLHDADVDVSALWARLEQQSIALAEAETKLKLALDAKTKFQTQLQHAAGDLNKLKTEQNLLVDDNHLKTTWITLRGTIRNWVYQYFDGDLKPSLWRPSPDSAVLTRLVRTYKPWIDSPAYRPLLAQGLFWQILQQRVFTDETFAALIWSGMSEGVAAGVSKLYSHFKQGMESAGESDAMSHIYVKQFHRWRSATSWLLEQRASSEDRRREIEKVVDRLVDKLHPLAKSNIKGARKKEIEGELFSIVSDAVKLDADMKKQRAVIRTWTPHLEGRKLPYGFEPTHEEFENDLEQPLETGTLVELVVAPALIKYGTSEGDRYDRADILVKCRIVQDSPEEKLNSSLSFSQRIFGRAAQFKSTKHSVEDRPDFEGDESR